MKKYRDIQVYDRTMPSGKVLTYRYHRKTRARLLTEPGTPEFDAEYTAATTASLRRDYIYFLLAETLDYIKIGRSKAPELRVSDFVTGCPDALRLLGAARRAGASKVEAALHTKFAKDRVRGEWFRSTPELLAEIENVCGTAAVYPVRHRVVS